MEKNHFQKLEEMYHKAPVNQYFGPKLKVEKGKTELQIAVKKDFFHAADAVHGAVYFKALDDASFFAVNSLVEDVFVLTAYFNIFFLKPVNSGILTARGSVVHESKSSFLAEASLYDQDGNLISRGSGSFIRSKILLNEDVGYK